MRAEVNSAKRIYLIKTFQHKYIWRYVYLIVCVMHIKR